MFFVFPSMAGPAEMAEEQVRKILGNVIKTAGSDRPEDQRNAELRRIIEANCDVTAMARQVLGNREWRKATSEQRAAFTDAFVGYFARRLGKSMVSLQGYRIKNLDGKLVKNHYEVFSRMSRGRNKRDINLKQVVSQSHMKNILCKSQQ